MIFFGQRLYVSFKCRAGPWHEPMGKASHFQCLKCIWIREILETIWFAKMFLFSVLEFTFNYKNVLFLKYRFCLRSLGNGESNIFYWKHFLIVFVVSYIKPSNQKICDLKWK
jgi:hypothetical protein